MTTAGVIYGSLGLLDLLCIPELIPDIPTATQRLQPASGAQGTRCCHTQQGDEQRARSSLSSQPYSFSLVFLPLLSPYCSLFFFFNLNFHPKFEMGEQG